MPRPKKIEASEEENSNEAVPEKTLEKTKEPTLNERPKTKTEIMKEALAKQPKRTIMIPLESSEKAGTAYETVQLNGYTYQIQKGVYVDVPEQVAKIIMNAQNLTREALDNAKRQTPSAERIELDNS